MGKISAELLDSLGEDYRIVDFDKSGEPIINPGEVIMIRHGTFIAYTGNTSKNNQKMLPDSQPKAVNPPKTKNWLD